MPLPLSIEEEEKNKQAAHRSTEEQVDMHATVGQRIDKKGTKLEDEGGTGQIDSEGG